MEETTEESVDDSCPLVEDLPFESVTWVDSTGAIPSRTFVRSQWENVQRWCGLIVEAARKHGFDEYLRELGYDLNLYGALMLVENPLGDPKARSRDQAVGLMQVMARDSRYEDGTLPMCRYGPCFASRPTMLELEDPAFNLDYGTGLLAGYMLYEDDSVGKGLVHYGPAEVGDSYADMVLWIYRQIVTE